MKTEFKPNETKAALLLIRKWREQAQEKRDLAESANERGASPWIPVGWLIEASFLESNADQLETDIENQSFNF